MTKQDILRSIYKPEEQLLVAKAIDSAFLCLKKLDYVFTEFLDPKSAKLVSSCISKIKGVGIMRFGGDDASERAILCFYPAGLNESGVSFPIKTLFVDSSKFVSNLTHRDFLGSLIGLGIDRCKIGDIFVENGNAAVFVREEIADFIKTELISVGRAKVKVSELREFSPLKKEGKTLTVTVASMRADAVLGEAFNISRNKASELIKSEKVFVNWETAGSVSGEIKEGDVISARGYGRAEIRGIKGKSKKGRVVLLIERFE